MTDHAKKTILIVDDEESIRLICEMALQQNGFRTVSLDNAQDALTQIQKQPIDLVLSDVFMPRMSGFQFLAHLKNDPYYRTIPVIFLTAATDNEHIMEGLELGAEDYISKPIRIKELIARVQMVLAKTEARKTLKPEPGHTIAVSETSGGSSGRPFGHLKDRSLLDLIAFCESNSLTGELILASPGHKGCVRFNKGELLDILLDGKSDDEAIDAMRSWKDGTFEIVQKMITLTEPPKQASTAPSASQGERKPAQPDLPKSVDASILVNLLEQVVRSASEPIGEVKAGSYFRRAQLSHVGRWPALGYFMVGEKGQIVMIKPLTLTNPDLAACALWIRDFLKMVSEKTPEHKADDVATIGRRSLPAEQYAALQAAGFWGHFESDLSTR